MLIFWFSTYLGWNGDNTSIPAVDFWYLFPMGHLYYYQVSCGPSTRTIFPLLPNTELTEHYVENILHVNATCDLGDCLGGIT
jgi:hypothetical protein